jgi:hypothetical protein
MYTFDNLLCISSNAPLSFWNTHVDMFHDFVDDVFRWALVDDKPKILLDTLHATHRDIYQAIYSIISVLLTLLSNKRDIFMWKETREILLKVDYGR